MYTTYRLKADELDMKLLESIKAAFKNKEIEITVSETDETEFLLRFPANMKYLYNAIDDVEHGRNIITPSQEQFK